MLKLCEINIFMSMNLYHLSLENDFYFSNALLLFLSLSNHAVKTRLNFRDPFSACTAENKHNATTRLHLLSTRMCFCVMYKLKSKRLDGEMKVDERKQRVHRVTFGSPCTSPDEIHHHRHQQINNELDCLVLTDRCSPCRWQIREDRFCHYSAANAPLLRCCRCTALREKV